MNYGPGYTMWQEILREREERRHARYLAKRAAAAAALEASGVAAPIRKRGRPKLATRAVEVIAANQQARGGRRPNPT